MRWRVSEASSAGLGISVWMGKWDGRPCHKAQTPQGQKPARGLLKAQNEKPLWLSERTLANRRGALRGGLAVLASESGLLGLLFLLLGHFVADDATACCAQKAMMNQVASDTANHSARNAACGVGSGGARRKNQGGEKSVNQVLAHCEVLQGGRRGEGFADEKILRAGRPKSKRFEKIMPFVEKKPHADQIFGPLRAWARLRFPIQRPILERLPWRASEWAEMLG